MVFCVVRIVIACLENGSAFIFYVGFGGLLYFLFKICIGGGFGVAMSVFF